MVGYVDYLFFNTKKGTREMTEYIDFWLAKVVVDLTVAGILIAIGFAVYLYFGWKKRKAQEK